MKCSGFMVHTNLLYRVNVYSSFIIIIIIIIAFFFKYLDIIIDVVFVKIDVVFVKIELLDYFYFSRLLINGGR